MGPPDWSMKEILPRHLSYWETSCGLSPSAGSLVSRPESVDVAIVGAGFCGSWLAYFLKAHYPRLRVAIFERDFLSLGASSRNAGFLSCGNISEWLEDFGALGWEETTRTLQARLEGIRILRRELGEEIRVEENGSADFDELTEEKVRFHTRLNDFLEAEGTGSLFEIRPARIGNKEVSVCFNRFDAQLNPCEALIALHRRLARSGVPIHWRTNVESLGEGKAVLRRDETISDLKYEQAFLCTNAFARRLNPSSRVQPARGQILVTTPVRTETTRTLGFLESGYDYFRFIGDRLLVGGGRLGFKDAEDTDRLETTDELRVYLTSLAGRVLGHEDFSIESHWSGIMGLRGGGHASLTDLLRPSPIDARTEEIAGFGGWGVTLAPYVALQRALHWA
jgi:gamma-glutamylputrescine oxidase